LICPLEESILALDFDDHHEERTEELNARANEGSWEKRNRPSGKHMSMPTNLPALWQSEARRVLGQKA
jgi:hypothetical protein